MSQSTVNFQQPQKKVRHILSLSGGKDSTALAVYLRDKLPNLEYVFCDTGEELCETYDYLDRMEAYLGRKIERLNPERPFQHYLLVYGGVLPDPRTRWCTRMLKIRPFERYVKDDPVILYVGIRSDEPHRTGYVSTKPNIIPRFPFVEDNITLEGVHRLLEKSGLGLPDYYRWRSRSGCYFCFFQQHREWIGLLENHPELFRKAMKYEKIDQTTGEGYTWIQRESLPQLIRPERIAAIKGEYERRKKRKAAFRRNDSLWNVFALDVDENRDGCLICHL